MSAKPHRPSRPFKRLSAVLLYLGKEVLAARGAPAAHNFHMKTARVALQRARSKCASARKFSVKTPYFFSWTPPRTPGGALCERAHLAGLVAARTGRTGVFPTRVHSPGRERG